MNDFSTDDAWQRSIRERLLLPHYRQLHDKKLFARWRDANTPREQERGDALFKMHDGTVIGIEEKIVRWPKRDESYTAITLETMSCTVEGHEKAGWMVTGRYDWLLHIRVSSDETFAECDAFEFAALKEWFTFSDHTAWPLHREKESNRTESRIVPLREIRAICRNFQFTVPDGSVAEIFGGEKFIHYCHCGKWGSFGVDVALRNGVTGQWFCGAHKPQPVIRQQL